MRMNIGVTALFYASVMGSAGAMPGDDLIGQATPAQLQALEIVLESTCSPSCGDSAELYLKLLAWTRQVESRPERAMDTLAAVRKLSLSIPVRYPPIMRLVEESNLEPGNAHSAKAAGRCVAPVQVLEVTETAAAAACVGAATKRCASGILAVLAAARAALVACADCSARSGAAVSAGDP